MAAKESQTLAGSGVIGSVVRAGLNTAPFAGGIASLWSDWDTSRRFKRVESAIRELGETLSSIGNRFDPSRLGEAEMQLLEQTMGRLSREHREWKRSYFVKLLASSWTNVDRSFEERALFERALDDIDHVHLKILQFLKREADQNAEPIRINDLYDKLFPSAEADFKFGVFMPAMNMLAAQFGFIRRKALGDGKLMRNINPDGLTFMAAATLVPLGRRFIDSLDLKAPHGSGAPDTSDAPTG
jgi:hypothetical protein